MAYGAHGFAIGQQQQRAPERNPGAQGFWQAPNLQGFPSPEEYLENQIGQVVDPFGQGGQQTQPMNRQQFVGEGMRDQFNQAEQPDPAGPDDGFWKRYDDYLNSGGLEAGANIADMLASRGEVRQGNSKFFPARDKPQDPGQVGLGMLAGSYF